VTGRRFVASSEDQGARLDVALARWLDESRSAAARRVDRGEVTVNGAEGRRATALAVGDEVEVASPAPQPEGGAGVPPPPVRHEDEHILVVAKPAGMVVHPGAGHPAGTLVQTLVDAGHRLAGTAGEGRPGIVHRLDRGTSGLLVVAKTDVAYAGLVSALKAREVERGYLVLVEGRTPARRGLIDVPIARHPREPTRFAARHGGREARTRWEVLAEGASRVPVTFIRCRLETGRTHQIRVHMSYTGNPVVGDPTYGADPRVAEDLELDRPFLHAGHLAFAHPVTGETISVDEPPPHDLANALRCAGISP
jgi:23S rRNA pseudouridine1911/1915/1917 synthase